MNNDLRESITKAGENLINALNPEQNYIPYFRMNIEDDLTAYMRMTWPQHNIGRWLDAMLRLEDSIGFKIPVHIEKAMLENYKQFFENPDGLCFQPADFEEKPFPLEIHSLREWILGLDALIKYRNDDWAKNAAHKMLETVRKIYIGDGKWNLESLDYLKVCKGEKLKRHFDPVGSNGRLLEALMMYHTTTGDELAMELGKEIAEYHYDATTSDDGGIEVPSKPRHLHSYLNTLQGLFLYGKKTGKTKYIKRVAITYKNTVLHIIKESGYASHDIGNESYVGETSSAADAVQLALWLAQEGYTEFLDDAERILRARLLPAQLMESPGLFPDAGKTGDSIENLNERSIGGFCCHKHPHSGKVNTTDVTAHCLHGMSDAYDRIVLERDGSSYVMLHFDCESSKVILKYSRGDNALLEVKVKEGTKLYIRIPRWTDKETVFIKVDGKNVECQYEENFAVLGHLAGGTKACLAYYLPEKITKETTDNVEYTFKWKGDEIVGVHPNIGINPFYNTLENM